MVGFGVGSINTEPSVLLPETINILRKIRTHICYLWALLLHYYYRHYCSLVASSELVVVLGEISLAGASGEISLSGASGELPLGAPQNHHYCSLLS
jgi:hypothetical protein